MIADTNNVCACYGLFILFRTGTMLIKVYPKFVLAIKAITIVDNNPNYCECTNNSSHFCHIYCCRIVEKQILKFGFANYINNLLC